MTIRKLAVAAAIVTGLVSAAATPSSAGTVVRDHGSKSQPIVRDHRSDAPHVRDHRSSAQVIKTGPSSFKRVGNSWSNWKPSR